MVKLFTKVYADSLVTLLYNGGLSLLKLGGGRFNGPIDDKECDDEYQENSDGVAYGVGNRCKSTI